jgi:serine phosphatase RsbU (regulator of sigma subunit)/pSer/pThr/pTyr-binding forkhead associated (FHA) protein
VKRGQPTGIAMPSLHVLKGPNAGLKVGLGKSVVIIGREAKDCDVVIPNQAVSRVHAQITEQGGQFFLEDLKSRNHTYLNNKLIDAKVPLRDNDRIKICDSLFSFHANPESLPPLPPEYRREEPSDEDIDLPSTVQATLSRVPQAQLLETQPAERLRALLEISGYLSSATEQSELLDRIIETLFNLFKQSDRCFIILREEGGKMVVRNFRSRRQSDETPRFSGTIVRKCLDGMEAFLVDDASTDSKFSMSQSITDFKIRSVMIAPVAVPSRGAFGVIQLDTQDRSKKFTEEDLRLLSSVAHQASVALENARLHQDQARRERVMRDLEIASEVQRSFLPQLLPAMTGYEFYAHYKSALTIGGDYYDFIELPDGRWSVLLGDVAGKGVPAALLMAKLSAEARFHMLTQADPCEALARVNEFMVRAGLSDRFVTLAVATLDPARHAVSLINAGHLSPLIYRAAEDRLVDAVDVDRTGFPLGVMDHCRFEAVEATLDPGDALVVFTDGVTDALNAENQAFKLEGVRRALASVSVVDDAVLSPALIGQRIIDAVRKHVAGHDQYDDIALVTFGRYDAPAASGPISGEGLRSTL